MALSDIITAIAAQLPAGTGSYMGPENLQANHAPPRVVWVPSQDRFGPVEGPGNTPRALRTRFAGVDVHVWGVDYNATESLLNSVLAAIYTLARGSFELASDHAGWLDMTGQVQNRGRVYAFRVWFKVPVTDAAPTTKTITAIPQTNVMSTGNPPVDENAG